VDKFLRGFVDSADSSGDSGVCSLRNFIAR
jgi:hypothetical protein